MFKISDTNPILRVKQRVDFFSKLPPEMALHVFSFFELPDMISVRQVSRLANELFASHGQSSLPQFEKHFPDIYKKMTPLNKDPVHLFVLCQSEFERLCTDYAIANTHDKKSAKLLIKRESDIALCKFARAFIGGDFVNRSKEPQKEASDWRNYLAEYPVPLAHLPMTHGDLPEHIPPEISQFTTLGSLFIEYPAKSLPPEIGRLSNLRNLRLTGTHLKTLPHEILDLKLSTLSFSKLDLCPKSLKILEKMKRNNPQMQIIVEQPQSDSQKATNLCWEYFCIGLGVW